MSALLEATLFIFGIVAVGYLVGISGMLKDKSGENLAEFATAFALPVLLFRTVSHADFGGVVPWALWGTYFAAVAASWAAGQFVVGRIFGRDARAAIIGGIIAGFSNLMLLGLPFMQAVFGQAGVSYLSLIVAVHLPSVMAASILLFSRVAASEGTPVSFARLAVDFGKAIASNSIVIGIILGLLFRLSGLSLPPVAARLVDTFADLAGPLALFAMGLGMRRFGIRADLGPAVTLSVLKLFFMPAVALGMAWLLGLSSVAAQVAIVGAAMPSGVNPYLFATRYGTGQAMSSTALTLGTIAAAFTLAAWLAVAQAIFP